MLPERLFDQGGNAVAHQLAVGQPIALLLDRGDQFPCASVAVAHEQHPSVPAIDLVFCGSTGDACVLVKRLALRYLNPCLAPIILHPNVLVAAAFRAGHAKAASKSNHLALPNMVETVTGRINGHLLALQQVSFETDTTL